MLFLLGFRITNISEDLVGSPFRRGPRICDVEFDIEVSFDIFSEEDEYRMLVKMNVKKYMKPKDEG